MPNSRPKQREGGRVTSPHRQSRRDFMVKVAAGLGAAAVGSPVDLRASGRSEGREMSTHLSRRDLENADISGYRILEPDRDLSKNGPSSFGGSVQLITPTAEMAEQYDLGSDFASKRLAWIGAPTYSSNRQKAYEGGGAIALVDLESGKYHAVIGTPLKSYYHKFGSGFKLSPSGRFLGIEADFGFAHILDQHTGKLTTLEHDNFGNYQYNSVDKMFRRDVERIGSAVDNGCTLEFIDDNTVVVSGSLDTFSGNNRARMTGSISAITFERFDVNGNHLGSMSKLLRNGGNPLEMSWVYRDAPPAQETIYRKGSGTSGAHLIFNNGYLYYASEDMYDPAYLDESGSIQTYLKANKIKSYIVPGKEIHRIQVHRGKIGIFDINDNFRDLDVSVYGTDPVAEANKNQFGSSLAIAGDCLLTNRVPNRAELREKIGSGSILIYSIKEGLPSLRGEVEIGTKLGLDVHADSFAAVTENRVAFPIIAISCAAGGECITQLGLLDLKSQSFKVLTGYPVLTKSAPIFVYSDANNPSRLIVGDPGYNKGEGRVIELDIKSTSLGVDDHYSKFGIDKN